MPLCIAASPIPHPLDRPPMALYTPHSGAEALRTAGPAGSGYFKTGAAKRS